MTSRPNILVILTEDLTPHSKTYGDPLSPMKSIDVIAENALVFENAYCVAPVCAPSRFSMITGIEPASCSPAHSHAADGVLPEGMRLLTHPLKDLGYYCTNYSKADYNFKANMPELWDDFSMESHWRNRAEGQPFFAFFNFTQTHESSLHGTEYSVVKPDQIEVPPYLPDTPDIREDFARAYTGMAKSEEMIAKLLAELEEDGLTDSTVIVQISDHGGSTPRSKRYLYDTGNKVPLMIKFPGATEQKRISTAVTLIDFAPTIIEIAGGVKPATMTGSSVLGLAHDDADRMVFTGRDRMDENYDLIRTARTSQYLYIRNYFPHRPLLQQQAYAWQAKGYQSWETEYLAGRTNALQSRYFEPKPVEEFYDNYADPHQINNLIDSPEHQERIQKHRDGLNRRTLEIFDNGFIPEGSKAAGLVNSRNPEIYPLARVLEMANKAIEINVANLALFIGALKDENEVVRFWAAQGLLYLAEKAAPAIDAVIAGLADESPHVRIVLAESADMLGERGKALATYRQLIDASLPYEVLIRLAKSMVYLKQLPNELLEDCKQMHQKLRDPGMATSGYFNAYSAFNYLIFRMEGKYKPDSPVFDMDLFVERMRKSNPAIFASMQQGRK